MSQQKNIWAEWGIKLSNLQKECQGLDTDLKLINTSITRLKSTVTDLEIMAKRINAAVEQFQMRINQLMESILKRIEQEGSDSLDKKKQQASAEKPKEPSKNQNPIILIDKGKSTAEKQPINKTTKAPGVMIFITPDIHNYKMELGESTCIPRRQLVPTVDEEKMILNYLIGHNHKPNQKDYNILYRELCSMLLNAPKNAIAIEIKTAAPREGKKFIEVFYHIKIKNSLDFARIKYIEIEGPSRRTQ